MQFFDQFENKIDEKGRLVLPAAWREAFVSGGYLSFLGSAIGLFTEDAYDKHRRKVALSGQFTRADLSQLMALTTPFKPDSQYRITVGPKLRERVDLEREVTIVGQESYAAIFSRSVWQAREAASIQPDESGLSLGDKFDRLETL